MTHFPSLDLQVEQLIDRFAVMPKVDRDQIQVVVSPYRICPIGAHVDHQGGDVLGKTINAYTLLAFVPNTEPVVHLQTTNYPGESRFEIDQIGAPDFSDWGRYASGAAKVLHQQHPLRQGITGLVAGTLPGSGLSSSASVGLAYLKALATANEIELPTLDYIEFDRQLENDYLGLSNGIQDQSAITRGQKDHLMHLNTLTWAVEQVPDRNIPEDVDLLIIYSGFSRELTSTGFNDRVGECRSAAGLLGAKIGRAAAILSDIPLETYEALKETLPDPLQRRAAHYFSEVARVQAGHEAWAAGDIEQFGGLMNRSCESSIHQYQSGSEAIIALQEIVRSTPGVYGSRFGGGGYGGCVLAFAQKEASEAALAEIQRRYEASLPNSNHPPRYLIAQFDNGLRLYGQDLL